MQIFQVKSSDKELKNNTVLKQDCSLYSLITKVKQSTLSVVLFQCVNNRSRVCPRYDNHQKLIIRSSSWVVPVVFRLGSTIRQLFSWFQQHSLQFNPNIVSYYTNTCNPTHSVIIYALSATPRPKSFVLGIPHIKYCILLGRKREVVVVACDYTSPLLQHSKTRKHRLAEGTKALS